MLISVTDMHYYMFNKPAGCITAKKDELHPVMMEYFKELDNPMLNPVGRLDIDTEGLIFVTDDGKWNNRLMQPESHVEKRYFFWALGSLDEEAVDKLQNGVMLNGPKGKLCKGVVTVEETDLLSNLPDYAKGKRYSMLGNNPRNNRITSGFITISEGKKHQVKRMLKAAGCYVIYLKRVAIGEVELDETLKPGEYRELTERELLSFKIASLGSVKQLYSLSV